MFLFYAIHYPQPGKEELLIPKMLQFGELIKQQPGVLFVNPSPFRDPTNGTLISISVWESQEAFQTVWPTLVQHAPSEEWEVKPREVYMFNTV